MSSTIFRTYAAVIAMTLIFVAPRAHGQATLPSPGLPAGSDSAAVEKLGNGIYGVGDVILDQDKRQVRLPAVVNQTTGPVEYLLVGSKGKTHESVLRTDVEPVQVHTAMLLLGVKIPPLAGGKAAAPPPSAIDAGYLAKAELPSGVPVTLAVRWAATAGGEMTTQSAESLIENTARHAAMSEGPWIYNGSFFTGVRFEAQAEKSIVAVITDPAALLNNPRPGHEDETIWLAAERRVPPVGTKVEFVIQLAKAAH